MNTDLLKAILAVLAIGISLPGAVRAQSTDNDGCSNATLVGDYAFTIYGQVFPPGKPVITRDGVAMTHFDGQGNIKQVDFVMQYPDANGNSSPVRNGDLPDNVTNFNVGEQGTYTVFEDCTGQMEIDFPPIGSGGAVIRLRFVLSDEGRTIHTAVYSVQPPQPVSPAPATVPALIHSEGRKLGHVPITFSGF